VGLADGLYRFDTMVRHRQGSHLRLALPEPEALSRTQRRQYFRVPVNLPGRLYRPGAAAPVAIRLLDLSGGGARLAAAVPLTPGEAVAVEFQLQGHRLRIGGRVVRTSPDHLEAGIAFIDLREAERDRIVAFSFQRQLELVRRPPPPARS
jgi:c-di-GMP-binding flagellar brake protein YcgR